MKGLFINNYFSKTEIIRNKYTDVKTKRRKGLKVIGIV
jgi:hypothetical protein